MHAGIPSPPPGSLPVFSLCFSASQVLLGANLDSDDAAKADQLEAAARLLRARRRERPFSALIWGYFHTRLVAFEELYPHVQLTGDQYELLDPAVDKLVQMIDDPAKRRELLSKSSLLYEGVDACMQAVRPSHSSQLLRRLFSLHVDAVAERDLPVPLPSFRRTPLDAAASVLLKCSASSVDLVCLDAAGRPAPPAGVPPSALGVTPRAASSTAAAYFGWHGAKKGHTSQRDIKADGGGEAGGYSGQYIQLGWLDGVGVYREGTVKAELRAWETDAGVQAFDHLPVRAVVEVDLGDGGPPLRVWLGSLKLERRHPTPAALEALLYGSPSATAEGADVVALSFTDLEVTQENAEEMRHLLRKSLRDRDDYVFNEDDGGLVLRHIPAQLVAVTNEGQRFMTLSVAVHRRNVQDTDHDGDEDNHDCFPVPVYLTCKSPRKNEVTACGKALIGQDVVICRGNAVLDLVIARISVPCN